MRFRAKSGSGATSCNPSATTDVTPGIAPLLLDIGWAAVTSRTSIVFLAHIFQKAEFVPVGTERQFKVLRERLGEDLRIVDGDLVQELVSFTLQVLDGVERIAVP